MHELDAETNIFVDESKLLSELPSDTKPAETDVVQLWDRVRDLLKNELDPQIYAAWIKPLRPALLENAVRPAALTLLAPNKFCSDHVQRHYGELIAATAQRQIAVQELTLIVKVANLPGYDAAAGTDLQPRSPYNRGRGTEVLSTLSSDPLSVIGLDANRGIPTEEQLQQNSHIRAATASVAAVRQATAVRSKPAPVEPDESNLNPKYNFSNYVVGGCNQFAHAACLKVAENLGHMYNPLFIYGGVGLGKTHLANAIGNASRRRKKKALLISSETFVSELISSLKSNAMDRFKSKFRSLDVLIIDDIQFIIGKERTQEEFFHTFNELYNRHKQIIITSDKIPQELTGLEERLRTRFACGLSADLQAPDFETRVAILNKKAEATGYTLPEDVARLIAERIDTNVRELEGALNRLQALCSLHESEPCMRLAEEVLRSLAPEKNRELNAEQIQKVVAARYNVSFSDILGKRRTHNIAFARQVAMYLCRQLTSCSYPELGALFGGRDHSTVIHAQKVVNERMENDRQFAYEVQSLKRDLLS